MVERIETESSDSDLDFYRASLRELFGSIKVVADEWEIRFEADLRETQAALLRATGGSANNVVAPARLRPCPSINRTGRRCASAPAS